MTEFDDQIIEQLTVTRSFLGFPRSYNTPDSDQFKNIIHPKESLNLGHDGVFYALILTLDDDSRTLQRFALMLNAVGTGSVSGHTTIDLYLGPITFDKAIERCFHPSPFIKPLTANVNAIDVGLIEKMARLEIAQIMRFIQRPNSLAAALWLHHIATLWVMIREYLTGQTVADTILNINDAVHSVITRIVDELDLTGINQLYEMRMSKLNRDTGIDIREADPLSTVMNIIQLKMVDVSRRAIVDFLHSHYRKCFEDHVREKFCDDPVKQRQMLIMAASYPIRDPAEYLTALLTMERSASGNVDGLGL